MKKIIPIFIIAGIIYAFNRKNDGDAEVTKPTPAPPFMPKPQQIKITKSIPRPMGPASLPKAVRGLEIVW